MTNGNAMIELCKLMLEGQLNGDVFAGWVAKHYGDPRELGRAQMDAIVQDFDRCLTPPAPWAEDAAVVELSEDEDFSMAGAN